MYARQNSLLPLQLEAGGVANLAGQSPKLQLTLPIDPVCPPGEDLGELVGGESVPLPDFVAMTISEHIRQYPPVEGIVFTWQGGLIQRTYYNNQIWKPALRKARVEPTRESGMHALRHHYASVLLDGGVSIRALAEYLGHSDPGFTLRIYAHLMPDSEDRARAVVDAAFRAPAESPRNMGTATP
jgi:hypothetical protein